MATKAPNYAALIAELDDIMLHLQDDSVDVDEAIRLYERGVAVTKELEVYLQAAENKIEELKSTHST